MQISFDTSTTGLDEINALMALLASLGGRVPHVDAVMPEMSVAPVKPTDHPLRTPNDAAEALMAAETARVSSASTNETNPAELDADGLPWDDRIHASSKARNADGTWRKKRGVDEVTFGQIAAELQEAQSGESAPDAEAAPPPPASEGGPSADGAPVSSAPETSPAPPPPPAATDSAGNAPPPPPATASAPTAPASPPAESAPAAGRFAAFPEFVQAVNAIRSPAIPYLELNSIAASIGVPGGFKDMKDHADLWETFYGMAGGQ